ncbi:sterol desaturase family protein [Algihabitans albus]|uniref:sterol desaturase family protein n=1 Tax=Algihabitans albus TaxID=2164067 RepID=UPI003A71C94E
MVNFGVWAGRKYFLDKMSLGDLVKAYFTYYAILVYLALAAAAIALSVALSDGLLAPLLSAAVVILLYPLVEYLLHRFVLHAQFLYKSPLTAKLWKRIHFDHHQNPNDLSVLFGALHTTLPPIALITLPLGWAIGGPGSAAAACAAGLLVFAFYEFCHCVQHLPFKPKSAWLQRIKKSHIAHHFHNEQGNFGITSFVWDRAFGTYYAHAKQIGRSPTVFNLGYTMAQTERYPWVEQLSEGPRRADPTCPDPTYPVPGE